MGECSPFFLQLIARAELDRQHFSQDVLDDLVFQKIEESDCSAFTREYPCQSGSSLLLGSFADPSAASSSGMPSQAWGTIWFFIAFCGCEYYVFVARGGGTDLPGYTVTAGIIGGLVLFKDNFEEQYLNSMTFLAT